MSNLKVYAGTFLKKEGRNIKKKFLNNHDGYIGAIEEEEEEKKEEEEEITRQTRRREK